MTINTDIIGSPMPHGRSTNISTVRLFVILSVFIRSDPYLGVSQLSRLLGYSKNMIHRNLKTLEKQKLVIQDPNSRKYCIGPSVLDMVNMHFPPPDLRAIAAPYLRKISEKTGFTVQLSLVSGDGQVVVEGVEDIGPIFSRMKLGQYVPLHASSASRAILASLSDAEIIDYLERNAPLEPFTEFTMTCKEVIFEDVWETRERGYAVSKDDYNVGMSGLSFAILRHDGTPVGALVIGGAITDLTTFSHEKVAAEAATLFEEFQSIVKIYL